MGRLYPNSTVSRESIFLPPALLLADAKAREDFAEHLLRADPPGQAAQRDSGQTQVLGAQLDGVGLAAKERIEVADGRLDLATVADASDRGVGRVANGCPGAGGNQGRQRVEPRARPRRYGEVVLSFSP